MNTNLKKIYTVLNVIMILATLVVGFCYLEFGGIVVKGAAGLSFTALGAVNLLFAYRSGAKSKKFALYMTLGLFTCFVADVVLNIEFIIGALIFAAGHVLYFVAYTQLVRFKLSDLVPTAVLFAATASFIIFAPILDFGSPLMFGVCLLYALIISFMCGKALSLWWGARTFSNLLLAIGCVLFVFSDTMLVVDIFGNGSRIFAILCLSSYYPAQALLGHTVYHKICAE